jgi:hypothetical protein
MARRGGPVHDETEHLRRTFLTEAIETRVHAVIPTSILHTLDDCTEGLLRAVCESTVIRKRINPGYSIEVARCGRLGGRVCRTVAGEHCLSRCRKRLILGTLAGPGHIARDERVEVARAIRAKAGVGVEHPTSRRLTANDCADGGRRA